MDLLEGLVNAASAAAPEVTGNVVHENKEFLQSQVDQLLLAEQQGVLDTECRKHKEWNPTLMNYCWNREKEGRDISSILKAAHFLLEWFPKSSNGLLYEEFTTISYIVECYDSGVIPDKPVLADDGSINDTEYKYRIACSDMKANGASILHSNRVQYTEVQRWLSLEYLMSEGDSQVMSIVTALQSWSANSRDTKTGVSWDRVVDRAWNMTNILLSLDDMNIRGYQLLYAMEYVDGSMQRLYEIINRGRNQELCSYINMRSAQDYKAGNHKHCQLAVTGGASFCHDGNYRYMCMDEKPELLLTPLNVDKYLNANIEPIKVDYSKLDIKNEIDIKSFMRVCEARGFKLIHQIKRPDRLSWSKFVYGLILYNPETKDYIHADTAKKDDVCYGGVSLNLHRVDIGDGCRTFHWNCSTGGHTGQDGFYCEFTHNEGLFRHWEESKDYVPEGFDFDWLKIGFDHYGIPVPVYTELKWVHPSDAADKLGPAFMTMHDMGEYHFTHALNGFLCLYDESLKNTASPHYSLYEKWYFEYGALDQVGWFSGISDSADILNAVYTYLKVPQDIVKEVVAGGKAHFAERDRIRDEQLKSNGGVSWRMNKSHDLKDFESCAKVLMTPYEHIDKIIAAYELPELKDLPVKLPWV